jgi:hypothetical protein
MDSFPHPATGVKAERDAAVSALRDVVALWDSSPGRTPASAALRMAAVARAALARLGELTPPTPADCFDYGADPAPADGDESGIDFGDFPAA